MEVVEPELEPKNRRAVEPNILEPMRRVEVNYQAFISWSSVRVSYLEFLCKEGTYSFISLHDISLHPRNKGHGDEFSDKTTRILSVRLAHKECHGF